MKSFLLIIFIIKATNGYPLLLSNCPVSCLCDLTSTILTIFSCTQPFTSLPSDFVSDPGLANVNIIFAQNCQIQSFPTNICQYPNLTTLDLSKNDITTLNNTNFSCLKKLVNLKLNYNNISMISSDAFDNLTNLTTLYLQNNKINEIPKGLFNTGLISLKNIYLSYNLLTSMELWPTYLSNIMFIDLKYNSIQKFTNYFGWYLASSSYLPALSSSTTIDLQFNNISSLDDKTIQQYGVCSYTDFTNFISNYFSVFYLNNNPIACSCLISQRLVSDSKTLFNMNPALTFSNIYNSQCLSPVAYASKSIFNFDDCSNNSSSNNYTNCINQPITSTNSVVLCGPGIKCPFGDPGIQSTTSSPLILSTSTSTIPPAIVSSASFYSLFSYLIFHSVLLLFTD
jgi:hypothetical protein